MPLELNTSRSCNRSCGKNKQPISTAHFPPVMHYLLSATRVVTPVLGLAMSQRVVTRLCMINSASIKTLASSDGH